jgi:hypothetical protein
MHLFLFIYNIIRPSHKTILRYRKMKTNIAVQKREFHYYDPNLYLSLSLYLCSYYQYNYGVFWMEVQM